MFELPPTIFSGYPASFLVKWGSVIGIVVIIAAWLFIIDRYFELKSHMPSRIDYIKLVRAARFRSVMLILLLSVVSAKLMLEEADNIKNSGKHSSMDIVQNAQSGRIHSSSNVPAMDGTEQNPDLTAEEVRLTDNVTDSRATTFQTIEQISQSTVAKMLVPADSAVAGETDNIIADELDSISPDTEGFVDTSAFIAPSSDNGDSDNSNGEKEYLENQLDNIKSRYEDMFVSYIFLRRCRRANDTDYPIILAALKRELQELETDTSFADEIYRAAEGSYSGLYARTPCSVENTEAIFQRYILHLSILEDRNANKLGESGGE